MQRKYNLNQQEIFQQNLKKEFGKGDNKLAKIAELKRVEQERYTIKEFVSKFRKIVDMKEDHL